MTIREVLEKLPPPLNAMAVRNLEQHRVLPGHTTVYSLAEAVAKGFKWCNTPEGSAFWNVVYDLSERGVHIASEVEELKRKFPRVFAQTSVASSTIYGRLDSQPPKENDGKLKVLNKSLFNVKPIKLNYED